MAKGETGIFVTIRFWTDFNKKVIPKQAWAAGSMRVRASKVHGIKSGESVMFNNLEEFMVKLDELLRQHEITLVISDEVGDYVPRLGKGYPKWTWTGT
ncbi:MAG: hypothetical protein QXV01_12320 [Candidatus Bathyarchaeia archaeon]